MRPPDASERAFFNLSDRVQVAMLDVRRTGYDEEGNPIRVTVTVYPGDRNQFEMEAGKVPPPPSAPKKLTGTRVAVMVALARTISPA